MAGDFPRRLFLHHITTGATMRRYKATLKHDLAGDGRVYKAGTVVGVIDAALPVTNLVSAMFFGDVVLVDETTNAEPSDVRHVRRNEPSTPPTADDVAEPQPVEHLDPDALNAADADDDEPTPPTQEPLKDETAKGELPPELQALPPRIAGALFEHEFTTRADVQTYLDEGGLLADVAGIGKAAERKILEWLKS